MNSQEETQIKQELRALVRITQISRGEDGQYDISYQVGGNFKERFKELHDLKRWSKKKFESWLSENINDIIRSQQEFQNAKEEE